MSIKVKVLLFFALLNILLICLSAVLWGMLNNYQVLTDLQVRRFDSRMLAEELRRSSDDLTRMARTYVVTGQTRYLKYFKLISAIRDGRVPRPENYQGIYWDFVTANEGHKIIGARKISIIDLMEEHGLSKGEIHLLSEAKRLSDDLIKIETRAFNALEGKFPDQDGNYSIKGTPDKKLARQLLFGPEYHRAKSKIMKKIDEFFKLLNKRTLVDVRRAEKRQNLLLMLAIALAGLLLGQGIIGYRLSQKDITKPLNQMVGWIKRVQKADYRFDVSSFKKDEIGILAHAINDMAGQIEGQITKLEHSSSTDPLTQINNRIALDKSLFDQKYKFDRYGTLCAIIMLDVDHFKAVNDRFGHVAGDRVLFQIAEILTSMSRASDVVGRWGGEEFLIICPSTDTASGGIVAELIRKRVAEHDFGKAGHVTVSLGVSAFDDNDAAIEEVVKRADLALYKSKASGRNLVSLSDAAGNS